MEALQFLHDVESFIGRELSREDGDAVIEMCDEEYSVQLAAELIMTSDDFARVYNSPYPQGYYNATGGK